MTADLIHTVIWFRLFERGVLTLFVLLACIWLVWKYIDQITNIDLSSEKLPLSKISTAIGTPVLIVLLFVGYTYVDLSNRIELSPVSETKDHPAASASSGIRMLDEPIERLPVGDRPEDPSKQQMALRQSADQAFALWTEQNLQRVFISLLNKATPPLTPDRASKTLNLSLAVGCLDSETISLTRNFDTFTANKDYGQIQTEIVSALKSRSFANSFCDALRQEL